MSYDRRLQDVEAKYGHLADAVFAAQRSLRETDANSAAAAILTGPDPLESSGPQEGGLAWHARRLFDLLNRQTPAPGILLERGRKVVATMTVDIRSKVAIRSGTLARVLAGLGEVATSALAMASNAIDRIAVLEASNAGPDIRVLATNLDAIDERLTAAISENLLPRLTNQEEALSSLRSRYETYIGAVREHLLPRFEALEARVGRSPDTASAGLPHPGSEDVAAPSVPIWTTDAPSPKPADATLGDVEMMAKNLYALYRGEAERTLHEVPVWEGLDEQRRNRFRAMARYVVRRLALATGVPK